MWTLIYNPYFEDPINPPVEHSRAKFNLIQQDNKLEKVEIYSPLIKYLNKQQRFTVVKSFIVPDNPLKNIDQKFLWLEIKYQGREEYEIDETISAFKIFDDFYTLNPVQFSVNPDDVLLFKYDLKNITEITNSFEIALLEPEMYLVDFILLYFTYKNNTV